MLDSIASTSQNKPIGNGQDVTSLVLHDIKTRSEMGAKKYGKPLQTNNGRDAMVDAYQEAIDLVLYLRQEIREKGHDGGAVVTGIQITTCDHITVRKVQSVGGDHMVVAAAKVSVSGDKATEFADASCALSNAGLINYLMAHRHGTPFEHSSLTMFVHAPIFVWREWHRHRIGFSYNEESARYKQLDPVFWIPSSERKIVPDEGHTSARPKLKAGTKQQYDWLVDDLVAGYQDAYARYQSRIDRGYAKEVARTGLPVAIFSSCWVTCNPRSLMAFLSLRTHEPEAKFVSYPQAEIEQAARAAEEILKEGWPLTYDAWVKNGRCSI